MDDYSGLWEVTGEVTGSFPGLDGEADQREAGRGVVRLLLDRGWVQLYRCEGDQMDVVPDTAIDRILESSASWVPCAGGVEYRLGVTDAGEHAFKTGEVR